MIFITFAEACSDFGRKAMTFCRHLRVLRHWRSPYQRVRADGQADGVLVGILIQGLIQTDIIFDVTLSSR
jgi:hypothetical protein